MSNFVFEEGFRKGGAGGKYGFGDEFNRMEMTPNQIQGFALQNAMERNYYSFIDNKEKRKTLVKEMEELESFRFMNVNFVAASLVIIDQFLEGVELSEFPQRLKNFIFNDKEIMDNFLPNLLDKDRLEKPSKISLAKKILFSYIFKILSYRSNPEANREKEFDELVEREPEIFQPSVSSPRY
jgi:hypothetical protein